MNAPIPDKSLTPLSDEQHRIFQQLIVSLNAEQIAWVGGYLTAVVPRAGGTASTAAGGAADITILVGSQTGNSEALAALAQQTASSRGLKTVVKKMGDYKLPQLKNEKFLMVIVSTHGEGVPPDNAKEFYDFLHSKRAPALKNTQFSVLGLGDSSYEFFCKMGKDFDKRLEELGASRYHPRVDCDVDYDNAAEAWIKGALDVLATKVEVSEPAPGFAGGSFAAPSASAYSRKNPFPALLLDNIVLNGRDSAKETRHVELSLEGSGLTYEPGDALGVYPTNAPDVVDELVAALHFKHSDGVNVEGETVTLNQALRRHFEATIITRPVIKNYAALARNKKLDELLDEKSKDALNDYLHGRELVDMVSDFPADDIAPQAFVDCLRKLPPRLYSIASSLKAHPDEVHLTAVAVRYVSHGRRRKGVCSTFLADRIDDDTRVPVYVDHNNNFKLPNDPAVPIIMVGPGTGIAPFRSFIEEREAIGASGKNWLFFGDQHFTTDFLYQAEWLRYLKDGILTRMDVAFSRDQAAKVYVQHRMEEQGRDLYGWLQDGAHFYVCGDEKRMAHDVHEALLNVLSREGGMSREQAEEYVKELQKNRRYQRDVY